MRLGSTGSFALKLDHCPNFKKSLRSILNTNDKDGLLTVSYLGFP